MTGGKVIESDHIILPSIQPSTTFGLTLIFMLVRSTLSILQYNGTNVRVHYIIFCLYSKSILNLQYIVVYRIYVHVSCVAVCI